MKRLLCILSSLNAGGAETFLMKVYRALPPEEYQFDFVVSAENGCYTQEVLERGGRIYFVPMRTKDLPGAFSAIRRIVKENKYEAVLKLADMPVGVVDLLAAKLGGAKRLVLRSCNALTGLTGKQKLIRAVFQPLLNLVANVKLAPSALAAEFTFGAAQARKHVLLINNGVDLTVYRYDEKDRQAIREEFSLGSKPVVGHVGRFSKQKNHAYLLKVFESIKKQAPEAVLVLVGTGELEAPIRQQVESMGLADSVIFTGVRFDVPKLLSAMDVMVFPSFHEGMPNTVIEAQATGLPCVIADTITREANITGLVQYLSLDTPPEQWAEQALAAVTCSRKDTISDFIDNQYDIQSVADQFVRLCFGG